VPLLRHGLLDHMRGEANYTEPWHLERDAEQELKFWIVQDLKYPVDGAGIICDTALMNGLYYRRCFPPLTSTGSPTSILRRLLTMTRYNCRISRKF
jgi:hypothetical protein